MRRSNIVKLVQFAVGILLLLSLHPIHAQFPTSGTYTSLSTGTERGFDRYEGEFLLVEAFATWCTPCKSEMYELSFLQDSFGDNLTLLSLSVSPGTDNLNKIETFKADAENIHDFTATWEFGLDQDSIFQEQMSISIVPTTFLFDNNGNVEKRWEGVVDADEIANYIGANVTFPERDKGNELLDTLIGSPLFRVTTVVLSLGIIYAVLIPKQNREN